MEKNNKKHQIGKINNIIQQIELQILEFVENDLEKRKKLLPINDKDTIKSLIWNLLTQDKWREQISLSDYSKIMEIWFNRLK